MTTLLGLDVTGRPVLVAGGGPVAARRAGALAADGALVTVVAPQLCEDLRDLVTSGAVAWAEREVAERDVDGTWLVHAATDDSEVNDALCAWASARRVWSVNAGDGDRGTARTPATTLHAGLAVGVVSTGRPDPARVAAVRDALDLTLASGQVDLRAHRPAVSDGASGRVLLVGGGPGAPDLVTVRARQALAMADVVVTDRLGPTMLLDTLPSGVEVIDVGKAPGHHPVPQEEINRLLVEHALRGRTVVRLKGGDPFLYGRGGEEQAACAEHGVAVEVVPGVSGALSAPTMAGIPVTHRGVASAVHVEHGHGSLGTAAVGTVLSGTGTLVVLMGVTHLGRHAAQLLEAGADPTTPVAVVESASLPNERVTRATLAGIGAEAVAAGVRSPAVLVVGAVAAAGLLTGRT